MLKYSDKFPITSEILWNYQRDKVNVDANENNAAHRKINNNKTIKSKFFEYKIKLIERTPKNNNILDPEVVVPLKYLSNFQRSLDFLLINCNLGGLFRCLC